MKSFAQTRHWKNLLFFTLIVVWLCSCNKDTMKSLECSSFSGSKMKKTATLSGNNRMEKTRKNIQNPTSRTAFKAAQVKQKKDKRLANKEDKTSQERVVHNSIDPVKPRMVTMLSQADTSFPAIHQMKNDPVHVQDREQPQHPRLLASSSSGKQTVEPMFSRNRIKEILNYFRIRENRSQSQDDPYGEGRRKNSSAIAAFILGLLFLLLLAAILVGGFMGFPVLLMNIMSGVWIGLGLSSFILGIIGIKRSKKHGLGQRGMAIFGLIMGCIFLAGIWFVLLAGFGAGANPN